MAIAIDSLEVAEFRVRGKRGDDVVEMLVCTTEEGDLKVYLTGRHTGNLHVIPSAGNCVILRAGE